MIELGGPDLTIEATVADGCFLAVIGPEVPCCLNTAVALDADGKELGRAD